MIQENYLYFAKPGQNDADQDSVLFPASRCYGIIAGGYRAAKIYFAPMDGTITVGDNVEIVTAGDPLVGTHISSKIAQQMVELINSNRVNTNNFTVVCDMNTNNPTNEGAISKRGLADGPLPVSGLAITTV